MASAPYDTVIVAINAANTRLNGRVETLQPIGGQVVGNTQSFSQQVCNDAWRKMQGKLADLRYSGLQTETLFTAVGPTGSNDPATQANINYANYFDGLNPQPVPVLPQNLIRPYALTERQNGSGTLFTEMDPLLYSLPRVPKANWNRQWLWRNNAIYLPGALVSTDISMLYAQLLSDFVDVTNPLTNQVVGPWFIQPVPILNCLDSLADYICREISVARGDMNAAVAFQQSAEDNARLILNQDTAAPKSIAKASEYGKMQDSRTPNTGADTEPVKR